MNSSKKIWKRNSTEEKRENQAVGDQWLQVRSQDNWDRENLKYHKRACALEAKPRTLAFFELTVGIFSGFTYLAYLTLAHVRIF